MGFIAPDDGGENMYIHCKQLVDTEWLQQGSTVSYDTEALRQVHAVMEPDLSRTSRHLKDMSASQEQLTNAHVETFELPQPQIVGEKRGRP